MTRKRNGGAIGAELTGRVSRRQICDAVLPEQIDLLVTAQQEIDRHLNSGGICTCCQEAWPCARACLAAFTLDAL
jgi:hypothetical protein